jgi:hypothetical protein
MHNIAALVEFFELWAVYDTDTLDGCLESIAEGDNPQPLRSFIKKHKLPWHIPAEVMRAHRASVKAKAKTKIEGKT